MRASRGMGAIAPSKMPSGKKKPRRDNTDFTEFAEGGKVKKFGAGGEPSLEELYPEAKITRAGSQPKPGEYSPNRIRIDEVGYKSEPAQAVRADYRTLTPYEKKAESKRFKGSSGAGGSDELLRAINKPYKSGGKVGLYANINAKKKRIAAGSGEKMRKPGSKGAPSKKDFINSLKTAKK